VGVNFQWNFVEGCAGCLLLFFLFLFYIENKYIYILHTYKEDFPLEIYSLTEMLLVNKHRLERLKSAKIQDFRPKKCLKMDDFDGF